MKMILSETSIRNLMRLLIEQQVAQVSSLAQSGDSSSNDDISDGEHLGYDENADVDLSGLKPNTNEVIKWIEKYGIDNKMNPKPFITSAFRSAKKQAEVMYVNWKAQGGMTKVKVNGKETVKGTAYLVALYHNKSLAQKIGEVFEKADSLDDAVSDAYALCAGISAHSKGEAFDVRSKNHPNIKAVLDKAKVFFGKKRIVIEIGDETDKEGAHWHIRVK